MGIAHVTLHAALPRSLGTHNLSSGRRQNAFQHQHQASRHQQLLDLQNSASQGLHEYIVTLTEALPCGDGTGLQRSSLRSLCVPTLHAQQHMLGRLLCPPALHTKRHIAGGARTAQNPIPRPGPTPGPPSCALSVCLPCMPSSTGQGGAHWPKPFPAPTPGPPSGCAAPPHARARAR
jgi:hypothetical protein